MKIELNVPNILNKETRGGQLAKRLAFLKAFNKEFKGISAPFPLDEIESCLRGKSKLTKKQINNDIFSRINDYDLCESMAITLLRKGEKTLNFFNHVCKDTYIPWLKGESDEKKLKFLAGQAEWFASHLYPRIRARLVYKELLFACTQDDKHLFDLIKICPNYLGSVYIQRKITLGRSGAIKDKDFPQGLASAIQSGPDYRHRTLSFWKINDRYNTISSLIKYYGKQLKEDKMGAEIFLNGIALDYGFSKTLTTLIQSNPRKFGAYAIEHLIEVGFIKERVTFTHTIRPEIKKIKENILYIDFEDFVGPIIGSLLDHTRLNPESSTTTIDWNTVENIKLPT